MAGQGLLPPPIPGHGLVLVALALGEALLEGVALVVDLVDELAQIVLPGRDGAHGVVDLLLPRRPQRLVVRVLPVRVEAEYPRRPQSSCGVRRCRVTPPSPE